ncbi:hypothetical protein Q0F99_12950 [Rathayibacter oskolensis]|nr:hypothetical protein [Rathayibacter oskolensis]WKK70701.1 hypothetical protein Q0F99_12950 [Rathayibacter oskolensis]
MQRHLDGAELGREHGVADDVALGQDQLRRQRQHEGGLELLGVRQPGSGRPRLADPLGRLLEARVVELQRLDALGRQQIDGRPQRGAVAPVAVDDHEHRPGGGEGPGDVDRDRGDGGRRERHRARVPRGAGGRSVGDRGEQERAEPLGRPFGDGLGDERVGRQREVQSVGLQCAERQQRDRGRLVADPVPGQVSRAQHAAILP